MKSDLTFTLGNGVQMPALGFGTFQIPEGSAVIDAVTTALKAGYRHIDTAAIYKNETGVGQALRQSGIPRQEIFLVSKLWNDRQDDALRAFEESLSRLGTDYLDLYLIHWPQKSSPKAWRDLNRLYQDGRVRAVGVSNFMVDHLESLIPSNTLQPLVNQVEFHPRLTLPDLRTYCRTRGILLEAWSPLMQGEILHIPEVLLLAEKYGKTPAQIVLRWDLQVGVATIPKSVTPERIASNRMVEDFVLSQEDVELLLALNQNRRTGMDPGVVFQ